MNQRIKRIPVILDTDIGSDIDDTWALAMLLRCPELDVRLVVSDTGNTEYRAAIIARLLEVAGRTDVPVGIGIKQTDERGPQSRWVDGYELDSYPGTLHRDGVHAIIETIEASPVPISLICIGPLPNIAEVLRQAPHIAPKTRFVGMHGSIRRHHDAGEGAIAEYNVAQNVKACQTVFGAPWLDVTITPLDTCGQVRLRGKKYHAIANSDDPLLRGVIENYRIWLKGKPDLESTILFDTVAVHLAYSTEYLSMEDMGIRVTDEGFTVPDRDCRRIHVALDWADLDGYETNLVSRLMGET
ncbi:MAG: nucleoside hydrolase [Armatimonadetes bacterium]|nr:nucleoside hydrolase [Armatimonadota bacterium]